MDYQQPLVDMGVALTELAIKGTVSAVHKKIKAAKNIKDLETLRNTYDELLNEVLNEREEAVNIAQAYKSELDRIEISDEDIEHLHNTATQVIEMLKNMTGEHDGYKELDTIKELINVDVLKTMQLLGFNYKAAIGEPLTQICAEKILSLSNGKQNKTSGQQGKKSK